VARWEPQGPLVDDALPEYLDAFSEPIQRDALHLRDLLAGAQHLAAAVTATERGPRPYEAWPRTPELSSGFSRLVGLTGRHLAAILDAWWAAGADDGMVTVERRLRLGPPETPSGKSWTMTGQIRRLTRCHWVPVVVELWPVYEAWTMMTMTPRVRVFASERYFRSGHRVLDRLTLDLCDASASAGFPPPRPPERQTASAASR
jgi:hypothetical protein